MSLGESFSEHIGYSRTKPAFSKTLNQSRYDWRFSLLILFIIASLLFLLSGLVRLQIFQGKYFRALAVNNLTAQRIIHSPRGIIYDRHNVIIAGNQGAFRLKQCVSDRCSAKIISREVALKLESEGLSGESTLEIDSERVYPLGESASGVTGYLSEINAPELKRNSSYSLGDQIGRGGIEEQYETQLKGVDGKELVEVDALGKKVRSLGEIPPVPGNDLHLTIDGGLQRVAVAALGGRRGALIASDPQTGEILAVASSPSFDPYIFTSLSMPEAQRDEAVLKILNDSGLPMFDRAITATYPPGSTFKLVMALAGLESGKITSATTIDDPGILVIGEYKFPNWKFLRDGGTQGILNVSGAITHSNDIFFYRVGEWTGLDNMENWSKKVGLGKKLGIDLPGEASGIYPGKEWRKSNNRDWYLGDTYHLAIGQGDLLVTPLQNNFWTNIIANGGKLCKPHLTNSGALQTANCKDLGIKKETIALIKEGMIGACSPGGTAYPLFNFQVPVSNSQTEKRQIQVACKTGTAEYGDPQDHTHAWLTAFAPACAGASAGEARCKPEISVTVILEGAGEGSDVAAPVVKKVLEEWFK